MINKGSFGSNHCYEARLRFWLSKRVFGQERFSNCWQRFWLPNTMWGTFVSIFNIRKCLPWSPHQCISRILKGKHCPWRGRSVIKIFWSIVLDDLWSKKIWKPKMIVWSPVLYLPLDDLVMRGRATYVKILCCFRLQLVRAILVENVKAEQRRSFSINRVLELRGETKF